MIAHRTYGAVSFLAERVKNRLRFAAPTRHKARRALAHRAFRLRGECVLPASLSHSEEAFAGPLPARHETVADRALSLPVRHSRASRIADEG
ncbi:hypothetical protein P3T25_009530 [Paraburkholderia sp. GAS32]